MKNSSAVRSKIVYCEYDMATQPNLYYYYYFYYCYFLAGEGMGRDSPSGDGERSALTATAGLKFAGRFEYRKFRCEHYRDVKRHKSGRNDYMRCKRDI